MNTPLHTHPRTLLVIVAEAALEKPLVRDARARGVQGWTVSEVHGRFFEGEREGAWEADRTIELKLLCDRATAEALASEVLARYAPHYSVAMYFTPAEVLRPERF
ncbi:transcriptional regulator [Aquincola tertiaricarbonis]|uniref:Transcriptional regulator n=1 Tax=Aquincola tertiaricarbonis TaxID=391953 RepID=A0ABY4S2T5_AQUTE|nr:transcriptional regulator [Aquincola tertiaricarbonis]URI06287.1 transcriptional regulator [Aquincola tertiaricarbonis]